MIKLRLAMSAMVVITAGAASAAPNLVKNGKFKAGNKDFTSGYTLTTMTPYLFQNGVSGIYAVELAGNIAGSAQYGDWTNISTDPSGKNTNVYVADGATSAGTVVWSQTVAVTPGAKYKFSFYTAEVSNACCSNATMAASVNGTTLGSLTANGAWQKAIFRWRAGKATTATLSLVDTNTSQDYNDFALDFISFTKLKH